MEKSPIKIKIEAKNIGQIDRITRILLRDTRVIRLSPTLENSDDKGYHRILNVEEVDIVG